MILLVAHKNGKQIRIKISEDKTISDLKHRLQYYRKLLCALKLRICSDYIVLTYNNRKLEDNILIGKCGFIKKSIISMSLSVLWQDDKRRKIELNYESTIKDLESSCSIKLGAPVTVEMFGKSCPSNENVRKYLRQENICFQIRKSGKNPRPAFLEEHRETSALSNLKNPNYGKIGKVSDLKSDNNLSKTLHKEGKGPERSEEIVGSLKLEKFQSKNTEHLYYRPNQSGQTKAKREKENVSQTNVQKLHLNSTLVEEDSGRILNEKVLTIRSMDVSNNGSKNESRSKGDLSSKGRVISSDVKKQKQECNKKLPSIDTVEEKVYIVQARKKSNSIVIRNSKSDNNLGGTINTEDGEVNWSKETNGPIESEKIQPKNTEYLHYLESAPKPKRHKKKAPTNSGQETNLDSIFVDKDSETNTIVKVSKIGPMDISNDDNKHRSNNKDLFSSEGGNNSKEIVVQKSKYNFINHQPTKAFEEKDDNKHRRMKRNKRSIEIRNSKSENNLVATINTEDREDNCSEKYNEPIKFENIQPKNAEDLHVSDQFISDLNRVKKHKGKKKKETYLEIKPMDIPNHIIKIKSNNKGLSSSEEGNNTNNFVVPKKMYNIINHSPNKTIDTNDSNIDDQRNDSMSSINSTDIDKMSKSSKKKLKPIENSLKTNFNNVVKETDSTILKQFLEKKSIENENVPWKLTLNLTNDLREGSSNTEASVSVDSGCSIDNLRDVISRHIKVNPCNLEIFFQGKPLRRDNIDKYGIVDQSWLVVRPKKRTVEQFFVTVKGTNGERDQKFLIDEFQTVEILKRMLREQYNVNIDCVKLSFGGSELKNEDYIREQNIPNGSTLVLEILDRDVRNNDDIQINVTMHISDNSASVSKKVTVSGDITIEELRSRLGALFEVDLSDYILSRYGEIMKKENTMSTYGLKGGDEVIISCSLLIRYFVASDGNSAKVHRFVFMPTDKVTDFKARIMTKTNVPTRSIILTYNGDVLEDNESLVHYGIENDSYLMMVSTLAGGCMRQLC